MNLTWIYTCKQLKSQFIESEAKDMYEFCLPQIQSYCVRNGSWELHGVIHVYKPIL